MAIPDPSYDTKNYEAIGGSSWVIGGTLDIAAGGKITNAGTQGVAPTEPASTGSTNSTPYGYTTSTQADAIVTWIRSVHTILVNVGIMA